MLALKIFEKYVPYALPFLLIFFRGLADFTVLLIGLIFLFKSYKDSNWSWANETWFKFSLLFVIYLSTVNAFLSINSSDSLLYALTFMRWPIFASALYFWIFRENDALKRFIFSCSIVLIFLIFDIWYQFFLGTDIFGFTKYSETRLTGPLRNNPVIGIFIAKYLFILLSSLLIFKVFKNKRMRFIYTITIILLGFTSVFITGERMTLILFVSSIFILFLGFGNSIKEKIIFFTIIIFFSVFFIQIMQYANPEISERAITSSIYKLQNFKESDYGMVFRTAYETWLFNPIFGGGLHQFKDLYLLYDINIWPNVRILHPHNHPLSLLVETGLIGLIIFYLMIFYIFRTALISSFTKKQWFKLSILFNMLYVCFFPFMTHYSFQHNWMNATTWLIVGIVLTLDNYKKNA
ncbi:O-antigen ligase family protein [Methylophilaceae bacterium]|nr:O-antigen ligase family protein [Methylophilaceae bacterium]|tara:strand:- start:4334 stop:5554 length:1221 start_codon:yes stop_codon:yes gene_type:complete